MASLDAYSPPEVAKRVEEFGIAKAQAPWFRSVMLGMLAGGFIGLAGLYFTVATTEPALWSTLVGGFVFSTGYILAILVGAEVFTSNNLMAMAWASRKITTWHLLRNWGLVMMANAVGAVGLAVIFVFSGLPEAQEGLVGVRSVEIAVERSALSPIEAFARGILGNLFISLAVWASLAGRSVTDKVIGMILPLSAVGAIGLEHLTASFYFLPRGLMVEWLFPELAADVPPIALAGGALNLVFVGLGNVIGGSLMVALVYHLIYLRNSQEES